MTARRRPFRVLRWLIAVRALGERRHEIERDLDELFHKRAAARGAVSAHVRYLLDVLSLWSQPIQRIDPVLGGTRPSWSDGIGRDVVYAGRIFLARPGMAIVTVLGLAVAIGVGTSVFAVLNAVALRPLGVPNPSAVVRVFQASTGSVSTTWPYREALAMRERSTQVPLELWTDADNAELAMQAGAERPMAVRPRFVGGAYFQRLGGDAAFGRLLDPRDDAPDAAPVVVLSHQFWTRAIGSDPSVVGRSVWVNGAPFTVVGVTARAFSDSVDRPPMFWVPLSAYAHFTRGVERFDRTTTRGVSLLARIPAGMTRAQAQTTMAAAAAGVAENFHGPAAPRGAGVQLMRLDQRYDGPGAARFVTAVVVVITVIGLLLLLACANVTNLQLASAASRYREIGMRLALGATRGRVVRQLLTESILLGLSGGLLGLLAAAWGFPLLKAMIRVPTDLDTAFDWRVYLFLTAVSLLAGIGAGLTPARHGARGDVLSAIRGDGRATAGPVPARRWRSFLVGAQATSSVVLMVLALLLARATSKASQIDVGFDADKLVVVSAGLRGYDDVRAGAFWETALANVRLVPGVASAAIVTFPPLGDGAMVTSMRRQGRRYTVFYNQVSADYFSTVGLPVLRGRVFTADEARTKAPVVVISEAVARDFWPGEDPIGLPSDRISDETPAPRIIGIVGNAVTMRLNDPDRAAIYTPVLTNPSARLIVRTGPSPRTIVQPLQAALRSIGPDLRPSAVLVADNVRRQMDEPRSIAALAGTIAAVAMALALVGIYGVAAFLVGQRTVEIGVRMAIGATLRNVIAMLLRDTLRPVAIGLGVGVVLSVLAARVFAGALFGVSSYDPIALSSAVGLLVLAATLAVVIPARRAARVDPASVLRS